MNIKKVNLLKKVENYNDCKISNKNVNTSNMSFNIISIV